jgi:outer membrane protein assembly factor BamB
VWRETGVVEKFSGETIPLRWRVPIGAGYTGPTVAAGRVYFTSGRGNTVVAAASPKFEVLSRNELNEDTLATPAISGGRVYLRTEGGLYCFGGR